MQRFLVLSLTILTASTAFAEDGLLGTKGDSVSAIQGPANSGGSLLQMIIAVVIVFGLMKFLLPKMMAKFGGRLTTGVGSSIKIEESASFPGGTLYLVNVKDRSLLLGVTPTSINTLAELGAVNKPNPGPAFMDYLDSTDGSKAVVMEVATAEPYEEIAEIESDDDAKVALERLQKLMS